MINFRLQASLKHGKAIKIDGDLAAEITVITPLSELPEVMKFALLSGKTFYLDVTEKIDENQKCG